LWEQILYPSIKNSQSGASHFYSLQENGTTPLIKLIQLNPEIGNKILEQYNEIYNSTGFVSPAIEDLVEFAITDLNFKNTILQLPDEFFDRIQMKPSVRKMVKEEKAKQRGEVHPEPEPEVEGFDITKLFEAPNWYMKYSLLTTEFSKEAGFADKMAMAIVSAIVMILLGSTIENAARKHNLRQEQVLKAMQDEEVVNKAREIVEQEQEVIKRKGPKQKFIPTPQSPKDREIAVDVLARTIYGEAGVYSSLDKMAVATIIFNRGRKHYEYFPKVVREPMQFSCWNKGTPEQGRGPNWEESVRIATSLMDGTFEPLPALEGYDHYYNPEISDPDWAYEINPQTGKRIRLRPYLTVGKHRFMKLGRWKRTV